MEKLLHYTWRHRLLPLRPTVTTDGEKLEIISPGLYNQSDAGPDFFNAKVKVNGVVWVGNVEIHLRASDWYRHGHDSDPAYDNVILHVVEQADKDAVTSKGRRLPTLVVPVPESLKADYESLISTERYPPCYKIIPSISALKVSSWLAALQTERLQQKTEAISSRVERLGGNWDDAYFFTIAHNFGFGINGEAMDAWSQVMNLRHADKHRDQLFQVEAMFLGQAGLLDRVDPSYAREYAYLAHKFSMQPMNASLWRYLRTRPQNFPHVRLMQLAKMFCERRTGLSALLACKDIKDIGRLYDVKGEKLRLMVINTAVPAIFAYGSSHVRDELCDRAFNLLDMLRPEDNNIVRMWADCGLSVTTAGESQALIQLKRRYCDRKDCLRCRFGHEFLTSPYRGAFFRESEID